MIASTKAAVLLANDDEFGMLQPGVWLGWLFVIAALCFIVAAFGLRDAYRSFKKGKPRKAVILFMVLILVCGSCALVDGILSLR